MLSNNARAAGADNSPPEGHGDGETERPRRQGKLQRKRMRGARDDGRIKTEQKTTERPNNRASPEVGVQSRVPFPSLGIYCLFA